MDLGLTGKIALVTAASKGLGFATARELLREGARVVINSHDAANLDAAGAVLRKELGPEAPLTTVTADLTDPADIELLVRTAGDAYGGLDILVTNGGGPPKGTFETTDLEGWRRGIDLTLLSAVRLVRAALPHLERSDTAGILTITSISVKQPIAGLHLSNVLRPAVVGLTKSLSQELGAKGVRVNSILPGWTATERVDELMQARAAAAGTTPEVEAASIAAGVPMGRMAEPEEFGRVATFMVSPAASYLNGAMIQLDGGAYAGLM